MLCVLTLDHIYVRSITFMYVWSSFGLDTLTSRS